MVAESDRHIAPTLEGSSGAPIILEDKIAGIHAGGYEPKGGSVLYEREKEYFTHHNYLVRLSDISSDLSEFVERN